MTSATVRSAIPGHRWTTCRKAPSEHARMASSSSHCFAEKDICRTHMTSGNALSGMQVCPRWLAGLQLYLLPVMCFASYTDHYHRVASESLQKDWSGGFSDG